MAAPAEESVTALDKLWRKYTTDEGLCYYHNMATGVTGWSLPVGHGIYTPADHVAGTVHRPSSGLALPPAPTDGPLGQDRPASPYEEDHWEEKQTREGKTFWYNRSSGQSTWRKPRSQNKALRMARSLEASVHRSRPASLALSEGEAAGYPGERRPSARRPSASPVPLSARPASYLEPESMGMRPLSGLAYEVPGQVAQTEQDAPPAPRPRYDSFVEPAHSGVRESQDGFPVYQTSASVRERKRREQPVGRQPDEPLPALPVRPSAASVGTLPSASRRASRISFHRDLQQLSVAFWVSAVLGCAVVALVVAFLVPEVSWITVDVSSATRTVARFEVGFWETCVKIAGVLPAQAQLTLLGVPPYPENRCYTNKLSVLGPRCAPEALICRTGDFMETLRMKDAVVLLTGVSGILTIVSLVFQARRRLRTPRRVLLVAVLLQTVSIALSIVLVEKQFRREGDDYASAYSGSHSVRIRYSLGFILLFASFGVLTLAAALVHYASRSHSRAKVSSIDL